MVSRCFRWSVSHPRKIHWVRIRTILNLLYNWISGWWFGTCNVLFFHILGISSSQPTDIFQRGRYTTNQIWLIHAYPTMQRLGACWERFGYPIHPVLIWKEPANNLRNWVSQPQDSHYYPVSCGVFWKPAAIWRTPSLNVMLSVVLSCKKPQMPIWSWVVDTKSANQKGLAWWFFRFASYMIYFLLFWYIPNEIAI